MRTCPALTGKMSRREIIEETETPPKTVIVKVPNVEALNRLRQMTNQNADQVETNEDAAGDVEETVRMMHNDECAVYKMMKEENILPMPRCHAAVPSIPNGDTGLIMLEDMSDKAVGMRSFADYLNLAQTLQMVDALASLHAWSARTSIPWRDHIATLSDRKVIYRTFFQFSPTFVPLVKDQFPEEFGSVDVDQVLNLLNVDSYLKILAPELTPRHKLPMVLVHGDVHCANVMFEKRESDGRAGDKLAAVIDFQLAHIGYGTEDLARLMSMATSSSVRREHGEAIVERYVQAFNEKIDDPCKHVKLNDVKEAYNEMFCLMAVWFSMTAAIAEDFLKKALEKETEEDRKATVRNFILNNSQMYRDAAKMLGWY